MEPQIITVGDHNWEEFLEQARDEKKGMGLIPRNYSSHPSGYQSAAPTFDESLLMDPAKYADALAQQQAEKASLFDLREQFYDILKSLNQSRYGLCWAFSTTKAQMYLRAINNEPMAILSAWWVAGMVKSWQDQGGWGAESLDLIAKLGVPLMSECPSYSRQYDNSQVRASAARRKATEWWDGTEDRQSNTAIMITAFLTNQPMALDFNWWSHSVCGCRLVSLNPLTIDIDNSWGEDQGDKGIFRLTGSKAVPDGIAVARVSNAVP